MHAVNEQIGANARKDPRKWAKDLIARHERGEPVTLAALEMARKALLSNHTIRRVK